MIPTVITPYSTHLERKTTCRILGLPPSILFFNTSTGWFGRFVLSTECYRTRRLGYNNLNWPRCSAQVTESLALTDGSFCRSKTLYILDYVKICEFMMCILIVNNQFNRMHPWCSWEGMLPGRCSPDKRCHTFWNGISWCCPWFWVN